MAFSLIPMLIMLAFYVFIIYVLVSVLKFMKSKNQHDAERNEKLDRLIALFEKQPLEKKIDLANELTEKRNNDEE